MSKILNSMNRKNINPSQVLTIGMAFIILIGAFLLNLPIASNNNKSIGFINSLFTASSALCVTGLSVVNTARHWTTFGHIVILILIQIGGLGFMTLATIIALILGKKITLRERLILKEEYNLDTLSGLVKLTKNIIYFTFFIEIIGTFLLSLRFVPEYGIRKGLWFSIFHSISSFCNAGFDIIGNSMIDYNDDIIIMTTIPILIIIGGMGYSVIYDILKNKKFKKLKLHSKVVISVTLILLIIGTLMFWLIESKNDLTIGEYSLKDKLLNSFFQSSTTRTAGFYSLSLQNITEATAFLFIILMFIGGSPASTAGGLKTTTIGIIVFSTISTIRGEKDVVIFGKNIPNKLIKKALALIFVSLTLIVLTSFILTIMEEEPFLDLLFETTSAFTTVGLSRGITPKLSKFSKVILSIGMYIGRIGPLTLGFAIGKKNKQNRLKYPDGYIMIG